MCYQNESFHNLIGTDTTYVFALQKLIENFDAAMQGALATAVSRPDVKFVVWSPNTAPFASITMGDGKLDAGAWEDWLRQAR